MIHAMLIVLVALVLARDGVDALPLVKDLSPGTAAAWSLGMMAALAIIAHAALWFCGKRLDRTGRWVYVTLAEGTLTTVRITAVLFQAVNIVLLGWLDAVRLQVGNLIFIDEALATLPPVLVFVLAWWSYYPVDRRLREASLLRLLEQSGEAPSLPSRAEYVWEQVRHSILLVLVPISLIAAWTETLDALLPDLIASRPALTHYAPTLSAGLHITGVVTVLLLMPLVLRRLWNTVPLGPGPLRERLMLLCRKQGVGCRNLLIWRTHSNMINGAVIGLVPWLRYILLTDALLERFGPDEVEAVMAHEVAHARRHHLPWLMLATVVSVVGCWTIAGFALAATALITGIPSLMVSEVSGLPMVFGIGAALLIFGWVSRRFEEQADAFAAQHLSGRTRETERRRDILIQPEAAMVMSRALGAVASMNHIPPRRFSWRHGSIASRQRRLMKLIGRPAHRLVIDRLVWWLKLIVIVGLVGIVALAAGVEWLT